ncbi:amidohydrolase family protein [Falsiroseomonas ponticola]|uniref:hypothetical protein n=1 Tax=Falsiroseomonas ponticola TaxID=2786951 RepID=UPI0019337A95|nr:hypothetical protein [Roseomonas ponticola]
MVGDFEYADPHCHGIGPIDFSEVGSYDLDTVELLLRAERSACIATVFLRRELIDAFSSMLSMFYLGRQEGRYRNLLGFALEGPLLAGRGGTPPLGFWRPDRAEWRRIANLGQKGLRYVVLAPDAATSHDEPSPHWVAALLLDHGLSPALGHFDPRHPARTVTTIDAVVIERDVAGPHAPPILTDHLFNDMPRLIRHAWRTAAEKARRDAEVEALDIERWALQDLDRQIGLVPAALIRHGAEGNIRNFINFDGDHLDILIARRALELIGEDGVLAMTDRLDSTVLCGHRLHRVPDNSLLYQDMGVVSAGTSTIARQASNLRRVGVDNDAIRKITLGNALDVFC